MKKVSFVMDLHKENIIFNKNVRLDKDNSNHKYHMLFDEFKRNGYLVATSDIHTVESSDIVIYKDYVKLNNIMAEKSYFIAMESEIITPQNFDRDYHKNFKKVFTWHDDYIDKNKYIKLNYAFKLPHKIPKKFINKKLCCLIISNKNSTFPDELYGERKKLIRWFEKEHPLDFDLYGFGWDEYIFTGHKLFKALNRLTFIKNLAYKLIGEKFSTYKGKVNDKYETMQNYKFSIAYENVKDVSGYITEKIFHSFFAGCVPVYWGADNITEYVPINCFIDRRKFSNNDDLYSYLIGMTKEEHLNYLDNIENFLNSEEGKKFSSEYNATVIVNTILEGE
jgi:hypothetical protein